MRGETNMEMKKFEEMKLIVTGDPEQDAVILEWLFLAVLAPISFSSREKGESKHENLRSRQNQVSGRKLFRLRADQPQIAEKLRVHRQPKASICATK